MATFTEVLSDFFHDHGTEMKNAVVWFFLVIALMHAFSYACTYVLTLFNVVRQGEKSQNSQWKTRSTAGFFLLFYLVYNTIVYALLLSTLNWKKMFYGRPFVKSIYSYSWANVLRIEPIILIVTTYDSQH